MENNKKNMKQKEEKINRKKEKVNRRENRKMKKKEDELRPWDALPNLALFNIFINLYFKDRFRSIPLVCKAWNYVISDDSRCYSSMIPESVSPEDAFINKPVYYSILQVDLPKLLYRGRGRYRPDPLGGKPDDPSPGSSYLRSFIKKSSSSCSSVGGGGGSSSSSSTITSLCLDPFSFPYRHNEFVDHNEILHLIAHSCPNLKHISFDGFYSGDYYASREAVFEVIHKCKKIELIDFSDSGYADSIKVIKELGNCLPNLRGIRMEGFKYYISRAIGYVATHFPWIKIHCEELQYYECEECHYSCKILVRELPRLQPIDTRLCYKCWLRVEAEATVEAAEEAYLEYLRDEEEDQYSILKVKKERRRYHQYVRVVVLRTRMRRKNNKKQQQHEAASFILKMKMRKKRDTYDYQDFYVRAAAF